MKLAIFSLSLGLAVLPRMEAQAWERPLEKWTEIEARRVLTDSPWARQVMPSKLIVRWESATPVVEARRIMHSISLEAPAGTVYRISIAGVGSDSDRPAKASLQYSGREPVDVSEVRVVKDTDGNALIVFQFPRVEQIRDPGMLRVLPFGIRLRPNEFRFAAKIGPAEVRQSFDLRGMIFRRELAL
jgi:hypothetical protein